MSRLLVETFAKIDIPNSVQINELMVGLSGERLELRSKRFLDNILMQCHSAVVTAAVAMDNMPMRLLLCFNSGPARSSENLNGRAVADVSIASQTIASVRLCSSGGSAESANLEDQTFLVWIDDPETEIEQAVLGRFKRWGFRNFPLIDDYFHQRKHDRHNRLLRKRLASFAANRPLVAPPRSIPLHNGDRREQIGALQPPRKGNVILFSLYWLDFGGAEAFAIQAMKAAKNAGYTVIVVAEEVARHRLLDKLKEVVDVAYLIGNFNYDLRRSDLFQRIVRVHRPSILHIHHSSTAYRLLPVFCLLDDRPAVIDTTHILEHRHGGFVYDSIRYSQYIDQHHVISRDLEQIYVTADRRLATKVKLGRLHEMSRHFAPTVGKWSKRLPVRVAFVGRLVEQKRPYLFLEVARRLSRRFKPSEVSFSLAGVGYLRDFLKERATDIGISERLTFFPGAYPMSEIFAESHVVINCSENEGLALTSYEGIMARCIVLSTDVGGQRELTAQSCLFSREPGACVRGMVKLVSRLIAGQLEPAPILDEQDRLLAAANGDKCGTDVCLDFYKAFH